LAPHTLIHSESVGVCPGLLHAFPPSSPSLSQETKEPAGLLLQSSSDAAMSLAPSIPSIKVKVGGVSVAPPHCSYRSSFAVIRNSKAEGPIRRPAAPPLSPPPPMPPKTPTLSTPPTLSQPPTPVKPAAPPTSSEQPPSPPEQKPVEAAATAAAVQKPVAGVVTLEYQRKVAKDLQEYFKQKKLEEADQGPFFGFLPKNEISNGRYVCPPARQIKFIEAEGVWTMKARSVLFSLLAFFKELQIYE